MLFLGLCLPAVPSSRPAGARARGAQGPSRLAVAMTLRLTPVFPGHALTGLSTAHQAGRDAVAWVLSYSKARPLWRTAQAMRASLLASAIASTLWCSRFLAASIHDLSPYRSHFFPSLTKTTHAACTNRARR